MDLLRSLAQALLHLSPDAMNALAHQMGQGLYVVLFLIVFAETGLVALPFLPGDSLLFAVGAVAASPTSPINLPVVAVLLIAAAIIGDAINYAIGYRLGPKVFSREDSWLLNKKHLSECIGSTSSTAGSRSSSLGSCRSCEPSPRSSRGSAR